MSIICISHELHYISHEYHMCITLLNSFVLVTVYEDFNVGDL